VPEVRVTVAHGRMPPTVPEDVMTAFYDGKYDVLLSTSTSRPPTSNSPSRRSRASTKSLPLNSGSSDTRSGKNTLNESSPIDDDDENESRLDHIDWGFVNTFAMITAEDKKDKEPENAD